MTLVDSIETNVIGPRVQFKKWSNMDWLIVSAKIIILSIYIILDTLLSLLSYKLYLITEGKLYRKIIKYNNSFWRRCPILGKNLIKVLPKFLFKINTKVLPLIDKSINLLQILYQQHSVQMSFKDNNNLRIFVTAESDTLDMYDNREQLTTLLLANHRSLTDYFLINYLLQENNVAKTSKLEIIRDYIKNQPLKLSKVNFISWGSIMNFPSLKFLISIFYNDENVGISPMQLKENIIEHGNQALVIFPEVNIMSTELSFIQRKINQKYSFAAKFYNVLYPRFKNFINTIEVFANLKNIKRKRHNKILENSKQKLNEKLGTIVNRVGNSQTNSLISPDESSPGISKKNGLSLGINYILKKQFTVADNPSEFLELNDFSDVEETKLTRINDYIYNITIIYYKLKYTENGHDHLNGSLKIHKGYQLEQINPSILQILKPKNKETDKENPPIVIIVHISKYETSSLLSLKDSMLEKWLEDTWKKNDSLIDSIENGIKLN